MAEVLAVTAHPDDESLYCGGTLRLLTQAGHESRLLTLTRGESGRTLGMCLLDELGDFREAELRNAATVLGISQVRLLAFPDGALAHAVERAARAVAEIVQEFNPKIVLTFPPNGMNGHPDHIATNRAVVQGIKMGGIASRPCVYFFASEVRFSEPSRPAFLDPEQVEQSSVIPTTIVDIRPALSWKLEALGHHESQARSTVKFMRLYPSRFCFEAFHLADNPSTFDELAKLL